MEMLLDAVTEVASLLSPEKVRTLAGRIQRLDTSKTSVSLSDVVGTPAARGVVDRLVEAWQTTSINSSTLASMLLAASYALESASNHQTTEFVWTGPTTPFVSARRTEQALLQVIGAAKQTLFITSFVAYDVLGIVKALNEANSRGVNISMLLESSKDQGGTVKFDAIKKMRALIPSARLYAWSERDARFAGGCVHAKVAVADGDVCFITSANLTGHAMEVNIEAGVLISGGVVPKLLHDHLEALVSTKLISLIGGAGSNTHGADV